MEISGITELLRTAFATGEGRKSRVHRRVFRRLPSAFLRPLPDFLFIGAKKSGTTSLYRHLAQQVHLHPALSRFSNFFFEDRFHQLGPAWYRCWFPLRSHLKEQRRKQGLSQFCFEASPDYFYAPEVPRRVARVLPEVRLILMVRNPVDRAYSEFYFDAAGRSRSGSKAAAGPEDSREAPAGTRREFARAVDKVSEKGAPEDSREIDELTDYPRFVRRSLYCFFLESWLENFSREQILVIKSENFFDKPGETLSRLAGWLGTDQLKATESRHRMSGFYPSLDEPTAVKLMEFYKPLNRRFYELVGRNLGWEEEVPGER